MSTVGELANTKCSHCRDILHWPLFARRVTSRLRDARRATKVNDNDRNHESLRRALHDLCCAFQHVDHTLPNYTNTIMFLTLRSHPSFLSYLTNAYRKKKPYCIKYLERATNQWDFSSIVAITNCRSRWHPAETLISIILHW